MSNDTEYEGLKAAETEACEDLARKGLELARIWFAWESEPPGPAKLALGREYGDLMTEFKSAAWRYEEKSRKVAEHQRDAELVARYTARAKASGLLLVKEKPFGPRHCPSCGAFMRRVPSPWFPSNRPLSFWACHRCNPASAFVGEV